MRINFSNSSGYLIGRLSGTWSLLPEFLTIFEIICLFIFLSVMEWELRKPVTSLCPSVHSSLKLQGEVSAHGHIILR